MFSFIDQQESQSSNIHCIRTIVLPSVRQTKPHSHKTFENKFPTRILKSSNQNAVFSDMKFSLDVFTA